MENTWNIKGKLKAPFERNDVSKEWDEKSIPQIVVEEDQSEREEQMNYAQQFYKCSNPYSEKSNSRPASPRIIEETSRKNSPIRNKSTNYLHIMKKSSIESEEIKANESRIYIQDLDGSSNKSVQY